MYSTALSASDEQQGEQQERAPGVLSHGSCACLGQVLIINVQLCLLYWAKSHLIKGAAIGSLPAVVSLRWFSIFVLARLALQACQASSTAHPAPTVKFL